LGDDGKSAPFGGAGSGRSSRRSDETGGLQDGDDQRRQRSGVRRLPSLRILGMCPTPAQGSSAITSIYEARYGVPPVGSRIFVAVNQMTDGWQSAETSFSALVPASA